MPIKLFARMRMRRGLRIDLFPNSLLGSEFAHALDTQELFIGNGSTSEGAPETGMTQILTEFTENLNVIKHTYKSNTDVVPQTGPTLITPTVRTLQAVLDDYVSIKDFGVTGDGSTDDSAAFNLATLQLYTVVGLEAPETYRRKLFMPAGNYRVIANELKIPSRAHIIGEGKYDTVIHLDSSASLTHLFRTADSLGQTGVAIGTAGAELPTDIILENMALVCDSYKALARLERVSNITFRNCVLSLGGIIGTGTAIVDATSLGGIITMTNFVFDNCEFDNYSQIFDFNPSYQVSGQTDVSNITMLNCKFAGTLPNFDNQAVVVGNIQNSATFQEPSIELLASQTNTTFLSLPLSTVGNSIFINYTLVQSGAIRVGKVLVISDGTNIHLGDDYHENNPTNILFDAVISGSNIDVVYTSGLDTSVLRYSIEFWGNT